MINPAKISTILALCPPEWLQRKMTVLSSEGFQHCHVPPFSSDAPAVVILVEFAHLATVKFVLQTVYPIDFHVLLKIKDQDELIKVKLVQIDSDHLAEALFIPTLDNKGSSEFFQEIVAQLRAPDGCPWDREQTHESLRPFLLEESYEMLDAMDRHDMQGMKEELGDVLLQIYLHAQIACERVLMLI